jgi:hypothetical protein
MAGAYRGAEERRRCGILRRMEEAIADPIRLENFLDRERALKTAGLDPS